MRLSLVGDAKARPSHLHSEKGVSLQTEADPHQRQATPHQHPEIEAHQGRHLRKIRPHHDEVAENHERNDKETGPRYGDETEEGIAT